MLDKHIIDAILEEERRKQEEADAGRARLELPLPEGDWRERPRDEAPEAGSEDDAERGVLIIPLR